MGKIIIRRIEIEYSGGSKEAGWLIFEEGNIQHPLLYLDDYRMIEIIEQYKKKNKVVK